MFNIFLQAVKGRSKRLSLHRDPGQLETGGEAR